MKPILAVPATLALVYRAWSHKSLTPAGIAAAALTAVVHAIHPWNLPFVLLVVFFLAGTRVTKVKKDVKESLTIQSTGSSGGEGPRTHIQVFANSGVASILILLHVYQLQRRDDSLAQNTCYAWGGDLLVIGIIANYAVVAADTFSSELGILSSSEPRLITSLNFRKVPKGTNGGVTAWGLIAGLIGSFVVVTAGMVFVPFCSVQPGRIGRFANGLAGGDGWGLTEKVYLAIALVIWGALGSVLDSILGGLLQQSVMDTRTGRIVEGEGGQRVLVSKVGAGPNSMHYKKRAELKAKLRSGDGKNAIPVAANVENEVGEKMGGSPRKYDGSKKTKKAASEDGKPSRKVVSGFSLLDNNEVNFLMALSMSVGAMMVAGWAWDIPFQTIVPKF